MPPDSRSAAAPRLCALPWSLPLPEAAAGWLIEQAAWTGEGPLDLRDWLIVVPTRQSSRRLREALAQAAAERDQAVFSPRVVVPEQIPALLVELPPVASRLESTLAWVRVLQEVPLGELRVLLPVEPPQRDFAWALGLATRLLRVQGQLVEEGLSFKAVAEREGHPEQERWRQLGWLEDRWRVVLAEAQRQPRGDAEAAGLDSVQVPEGCARVAWIGVPDALGVAVNYGERLAALCPVDVLVYFDPAFGAVDDAFDAWGRPRSDFWAGRELPWQDFERQVRLMANPAAQAERIAAVAQQHERPDEWLAVALVDPEVRAPLEQELAAAEVHSFNPEGEPWAQGRLYGLLAKLAALVAAPGEAEIGALLRHPDVLATLIAGRGPQGETALPTTLLEQWDRLREQHLVEDLAQARTHAGRWPLLQAALAQVADWREQMLDGAFVDGAIALPARFYGDREIEGGSALAEAARHWVETVEAWEAAGGLVDGLSRAEQWRLAVQGFGEGARFAPKPADALELGGWLELLWADAERVVVAGVNEGLLPESVVGDAFLPEGLRVELGLRSNAQRGARDAYLLAAVLASRKGEYVELLVGKTADNGEPLRPSRLLLAGNDEALPARVRRLFRPLESQQANLPWRRAWQLETPRAKLPDAVSVTALRDWLDCPYRFYLKRVLRMEPRDLQKAELDARDFGSLVHLALEAMGEQPALRDCTDEGKLRDGLLAVLEAAAKERFGDTWSLPLQIQMESARQRLRRVAAVEVAERQAGWRTERVEWEFAVPLGPLTVRGKIDRIDRHEDGRVRVIDYKTSDRPVEPIEAHLDRLREDDHDRPEWLRVEYGGKERRWCDLQLPLYRRALAPEYGDELDCLYFNLPKAVGETGLLAWPEGLPELQQAAERCAERVAESIAAGVFWPPVEDAGRAGDEWEQLFHDGVAASVSENWIRQSGKEVAP
ncbi:PD-(D/E)XK nuclease family protein [Actomonas aquatica]|uniref:PD-(D/E)XK nuclease family protein n=1 Tax=Actomonas aquatica TaxID=2866162 RepID=A0ABZ1C5V1_9BACT|nr:PD-(D/E)XK nuclease family protein [Opitutus sp. WL0086]WRQ86792.1 PD-(D/E)XK nuclease family protein [Opitutus sp. WL0086]